MIMIDIMAHGTYQFIVNFYFNYLLHVNNIPRLFPLFSAILLLPPAAGSGNALELNRNQNPRSNQSFFANEFPINRTKKSEVN